MSDIIRAQSYTFSQFFDRNYFHVPIFQREFSWRKENVNDFWEDIFEAMTDHKNHFFGSIVLQAGKKDHHYYIFDGQQRLTVVVSLISIIRKELLNLLIESESSNNDIESFINKTHKYLWDKDNQSYLQLSSQNQRIFLAYLRDPNSILHDNRFRSNEFIKNHVFKNFIDKINDEFQNYSTVPDKLKFLNQLFYFLSNNLYFAVIYADIHFSASSLFETLNYRGATLKVEDLLKSFILSKALEQRTLKTVEGLWTENLEIIDNNRLSFSEYLKNYWSFKNAKIVEGSLYKILKKDIEIDDVDILDYMEKMNHYLKLYITIAYPNRTNVWKNNIKIQNTLHALSIIGAKQCYPLLLSIFSVGKTNDDLSILKLQLKLLIILENLFFRIHICNQNINIDIIKLLTDYIPKVRVNPEIEIESLIKDLKYYYPNDKIFEQEFSSYVSPNRSMSFYILNKIERYLRGRAEPTSDNPKEVSIEHIMPQKLGYGWKHVLHYHKSYLNRLGNLTLISKSLNVTNTGFLRKRNNFYIKSNIKITHLLESYTNWRKKEINDRQKELAQKAIEIWK